MLHLALLHSRGFLIDSRHFNGMGIHLTCPEERLGWHRLLPAQSGLEIGRNVGLQFHLESSRQSIRRLIDNCGDELTPGRFVQEPEDMLSAEKHLKELYQHLGIFMKNIELMVDRD